MNWFHVTLLCIGVGAIILGVGYYLGCKYPYAAAKKKILADAQASITKLMKA